jgi:hypothetical protein
MVDPRRRRGNQLTYKLFNTILGQRLRNGELVRPIIFFDLDESEKRDLFMPPALRETIQQIHPKMAREYAANIRAYLGRYIKGKEVIDNKDFMKCWKEDVFELRVQNQKRADRLRIFGAFGKPDTFIAFFRKPRAYFGNKDDPKWDEAIYRVVEEWNIMFPGCPRVPAQPFSNCLTFKYFDVNDVGV